MVDEIKRNLLIDDWIKARDKAADLLVEYLSLESPRDVLNSQYRGRHILSHSGWAYRTHGIGVDGFVLIAFRC